MMQISVSEIVRAINQLPKNRGYNYINKTNRGKIRIVSIQEPEGPIYIKRFDPSKGEIFDTAKTESISTQMLWRVANALMPGHPVNVDRILGASYNTRSVLESLIAHTPEFYYCFPGRIESIRSSTNIKKGHKHIIWQPSVPHELGVLVQTETDIVISEVPTVDVIYDALKLPDARKDQELNIEVRRRHAQVQIALIMIGLQLNFRIWVAQNDKSIVYNEKKIGEIPGVISSLNDEKLLMAHDDAVKAALLIDCIWFRNSRFMPAVIEIEHSTGVISGLTRMKNFQDRIPPFPTRWVIVAADEDRKDVFKKANLPQFKSLDTKFFPYSAVEELYSLCQRRKLKGVNDDFLDCFMEPCLS